MSHMHRFTLPSPLGRLPAGTPRDRDTAAKLNEFFSRVTSPFSRGTLEGHVTGSAFILNETGSKVLLMHHAKLDRWLQPGGHCDGIEDTHFVALKEAYEETGLSLIKSLSPQIFDVDIHEIPRRGDIPAHLHYDIRYLFCADDTLSIPGNHESNGLEWASISQAIAMAPDLEEPLRKLHAGHA